MEKRLLPQRSLINNTVVLLFVVFQAFEKSMHETFLFLQGAAGASGEGTERGTGEGASTRQIPSRGEGQEGGDVGSCLLREAEETVRNRQGLAAGVRSELGSLQELERVGWRS